MTLRMRFAFGLLLCALPRVACDQDAINDVEESLPDMEKPIALSEPFNHDESELVVDRSTELDETAGSLLHDGGELPPSTDTEQQEDAVEPLASGVTSQPTLDSREPPQRDPKHLSPLEHTEAIPQMEKQDSIAREPQFHDGSHQPGPTRSTMSWSSGGGVSGGSSCAPGDESCPAQPPAELEYKHVPHHTTTTTTTTPPYVPLSPVNGAPEFSSELPSGAIEDWWVLVTKQDWKGVLYALYHMFDVVLTWMQSLAFDAGAAASVGFVAFDPPLSIIVRVFVVLLAILISLRSLPVAEAAKQAPPQKTKTLARTPAPAPAAAPAPTPVVNPEALERLERQVQQLLAAHERTSEELRHAVAVNAEGIARLSNDIHSYQKERNSMDEEMLLSTKEILDWLAGDNRADVSLDSTLEGPLPTGLPQLRNTEQWATVAASGPRQFVGVSPAVSERPGSPAEVPPASSPRIPSPAPAPRPLPEPAAMMESRSPYSDMVPAVEPPAAVSPAVVPPAAVPPAVVPPAVLQPAVVPSPVERVPVVPPAVEPPAMPVAVDPPALIPPVQPTGGAAPFVPGVPQDSPRPSAQAVAPPIATPPATIPAPAAAQAVVPPVPLATLSNAVAPPAVAPSASPRPAQVTEGVHATPETAQVGGRPTPQPIVASGNPFGRPKQQPIQARGNPFGRPVQKEIVAQTGPFG